MLRIKLIGMTLAILVPIFFRQAFGVEAGLHDYLSKAYFSSDTKAVALDIDNSKFEKDLESEFSVLLEKSENLSNEDYIVALILIESHLGTESKNDVFSSDKNIMITRFSEGSDEKLGIPFLKLATLDADPDVLDQFKDHVKKKYFAGREVIYETKNSKDGAKDLFDSTGVKFARDKLISHEEFALAIKELTSQFQGKELNILADYPKIEIAMETDLKIAKDGYITLGLFDVGDSSHLSSVVEGSSLIELFEDEKPKYFVKDADENTYKDDVNFRSPRNYNSSPAISVYKTPRDYPLVKTGQLGAGAAVITRSGKLAGGGIVAIVHAAPGSFERRLDKIDGGKDADLVEPSVDSVDRSISNSMFLAKEAKFGKIAIPFIGENFIDEIGISKRELAYKIIKRVVEKSKEFKMTVVIVPGDKEGTEAFIQAKKYMQYPKKCKTWFYSLDQQKSPIPDCDVKGERPKHKTTFEKYVIVKEDGESIVKHSDHGADLIVNSANTEFLFEDGVSQQIGEATGEASKLEAEIQQTIASYYKSFLDKD